MSKAKWNADVDNFLVRLVALKRTPFGHTPWEEIANTIANGKVFSAKSCMTRFGQLMRTTIDQCNALKLVCDLATGIDESMQEMASAKPIEMVTTDVIAKDRKIDEDARPRKKKKSKKSKTPKKSEELSAHPEVVEVDMEGESAEMTTAEQTDVANKKSKKRKRKDKEDTTGAGEKGKGEESEEVAVAEVNVAVFTQENMTEQQPKRKKKKTKKLAEESSVPKEEAVQLPEVPDDSPPKSGKTQPTVRCEQRQEAGDVSRISTNEQGTTILPLRSAPVNRHPPTAPKAMSQKAPECPALEPNSSNKLNDAHRSNGVWYNGRQGTALGPRDVQWRQVQIHQTQVDKQKSLQQRINSIQNQLNSLGRQL